MMRNDTSCKRLNVISRKRISVLFIFLFLSYFSIAKAEGEKINVTQMMLSTTNSAQVGIPVTVTVNANISGGETLYYKYFYRGNYGTDQYDTSPWVVVQDYVANNSAQYSFPEVGNYIIVVRVVTDPQNEPAFPPIIGQVVTVNDSGKVIISNMLSDATSTPNVGEPVTFTVTAANAAAEDVYYRFYYRANFGTDQYDTSPWIVVQEYSTNNSCQYTFPSASDYIVVVRATTEPANEPQALPIIGGVVSVNEADVFQVTSTAFVEGGDIPDKYSCSGMDVSPPLSFSDVPEGTQSIAVICDDPDAPGGTFVHWVLFNLPGSATSLEENAGSSGTLSNGAIHGINDFGSTSYGGPCPPYGTHRYYFKIYALDTTLGLNVGATKSQVEAAMSGHILSEAQLMGRYGN